MAQEQINKNFNEFLANPHWKAYYENAPQNTKEYIQIEFAMSHAAILTDTRRDNPVY